MIYESFSRAKLSQIIQEARALKYKQEQYKYDCGYNIDSSTDYAK